MSNECKIRFTPFFQHVVMQQLSSFSWDFDDGHEYKAKNGIKVVFCNQMDDLYTRTIRLSPNGSHAVKVAFATCPEEAIRNYVAAVAEAFQPNPPTLPAYGEPSNDIYVFPHITFYLRDIGCHVLFQVQKQSLPDTAKSGIVYKGVGTSRIEIAERPAILYNLKNEVTIRLRGTDPRQNLAIACWGFLTPAVAYQYALDAYKLLADYENSLCADYTQEGDIYTFPIKREVDAT